MLEQLISQIASITNAIDDVHVFQEFHLGSNGYRNELLLFVKPEVFMINDIYKINVTLNVIFDKIKEFNSRINGIALVGGKILEEKKIMSRHYGVISELSNHASTMISSIDYSMIKQRLNLEDISDYKILGGHEYMREHSEITLDEMQRIWRPEKSCKLRSGFYVHTHENSYEKVILVNGFHPQQLARFTRDTGKILLVLIHSNIDWIILRNEMVGSTFPHKAKEGSIRHSLYISPNKFGFETVTAENNGVHLSAGPFEGAFEIINFLGSVINLNIETTQPMVIKALQDSGYPLSEAISTINNPKIIMNGKIIDLFSATEDLNTSDAIEVWIKSSHKYLD